eukprot:jgi/Chlat1/686/Chrsp104S01281
MLTGSTPAIALKLHCDHFCTAKEHSYLRGLPVYALGVAQMIRCTPPVSPNEASQAESDVVGCMVRSVYLCGEGSGFGISKVVLDVAGTHNVEAEHAQVRLHREVVIGAHPRLHGAEDVGDAVPQRGIAISEADGGEDEAGDAVDPDVGLHRSTRCRAPPASSSRTASRSQWLPPSDTATIPMATPTWVNVPSSVPHVRREGGDVKEVVRLAAWSRRAMPATRVMRSRSPREPSVVALSGLVIVASADCAVLLKKRGASPVAAATLART